GERHALAVEHAAELLDALVAQLRERQPGVGGVDLVHAELLDLAQLGGPHGRGGLEGGRAVRGGAAEREHVGADGPVLCGEHRCPFVGSPSAISYRKSSERESLPALRAVPARRTPPGAVPTLVMSVTAPSGVSAARREVRGGSVSPLLPQRSRRPP